MLMQEYRTLENKQILISVINYANEEEVIAFAQHLAQQSNVKELLLAVTVNKRTEDKRQWLQDELNGLDMDVILLDPEKNLGYLNGCLAPYEQLRKAAKLDLKWVIISNTDIEFAQKDFFAKLLQQRYPKDVGCIAPNVYVPTTGAFENPRYLKRFTKPEIEKRIKVFSSPTLSGLYQRLSSLKAGRSRGEEQDSQYVYLAHGCCFAVSAELADALCDIPYSALLYSEEAYVAEMAIQIGKRVYYDQSLKLYHHENAVTGKLKNEQRSKMIADSLSMILRQFYSKKAAEKAYTAEDVCAAIVSYNDPGNIEHNVSRLRDLGVAVVIVDNGSNAETVAQLERMQEKYGITLLRNTENMGIATALQQGLMYAYEQKYSLYLTLDQDSLLCEGAVEEMLRILQEDTTIASVGPAYSIENIAATEAAPRYTDYLITSGSITRVNPAVCVGGFDEALFIDSVDFDFSLKLRQNGYQLAVAPGAHLKHKIGETYQAKLLFWKLSLGIHSPLRYYYMVRNHVEIRKRYRKTFPKFCFKKSISMFMEMWKVRLFFPDKTKYMTAVKKGREDAKLGHFGKYKGSF